MRSPGVIQRAVATLAMSFLLSPPSFAMEQDKPAGQETVTVKLATNLVSVNVTVTDGYGRAVTGLTRENFKIYENDVEQVITFFSSEEAPVSWGLVLDRSGSMMEMIQDVYRAALHVIDEGTEQDEMFILTFNNQIELVCDFTSDKHKLENSILGLRAGGTTALWDAIAFGLGHIKQGKHEKKVLVVVTDGEDNSSRLKFRQLIERAEEEDVLIYTVGMFESRGWLMPRIGDSYAREELEKLAEVTGARAHFPTNIERCRQTMKEIAREVSHQYSLGYYPSNATLDGKWRKIKIVVTGQGEKDAKYVARTRTGYYARRGEGVK